MLPPITETIAEVRKAVADARSAGRSIGLVPTMGALHEGHLALIRAARSASEFVVVSIFVNPTQFGPNEDFARYPRTFEADRKTCEEAGADLIFAPSADEVFPAGTTTHVEVPDLQNVLCGQSRPGHFRGVCTVVLKLFNIVQPDVAVFGAKDFQQSLIIRHMVRDLNVPVQIQVGPTVREADGLALSSRNRYLTPDQRAAAPRIYAELKQARDQVLANPANVAEIEAALNESLGAIPGAKVNYARILDADTLQPIERFESSAVAAVAVFFGNTRLIDNITIP